MQRMVLQTSCRATFLSLLLPAHSESGSYLATLQTTRGLDQRMAIPWRIDY